MKHVLTAFACLLACSFCFAQKQDYKVLVIGFYNLENFYDTIDNPMINDDDFTPKGANKYVPSIYLDKVGKLATVISQIGTDEDPRTPDGPAVLGVAEIENDTVLTDLVNHPLLKSRGYKFVHYDGPDARGIDCALLYNPKYFTPEESRSMYVDLPGGSKDAYFTRDVLWVKGKLDGETVHFYVNHWPSRRGGEERSAPGRAAAAMVSKKHMDSIRLADGEQKVIIMGDLNDNPTDASIIKVLGCKANKEEVKPGGLYNPWINLYTRGIGTLGYQDAWSLFDQSMLSYPWLNKNQTGYFFYKQVIFNREYLTENLGKYKGYPMRTWDFSNYRGGYSDHFPTYLIMLKKKNAAATSKMQ